MNTIDYAAAAARQQKIGKWWIVVWRGLSGRWVAQAARTRFRASEAGLINDSDTYFEFGSTPEAAIEVLLDSLSPWNRLRESLMQKLHSLGRAA